MMGFATLNPSTRFTQRDYRAIPDDRTLFASHPAADRLQRLHDHGPVPHLRFREVPLCQVIRISRGLAFCQYCPAVPGRLTG